MSIKERLKKAFTAIRKTEKKEEVRPSIVKKAMNAHTLSLYAMEKIGDISSIGPRLSLTKEERMAGNRVAAVLEENGCSVESQEFKAENKTELLWQKIVGLLLPIVPILLIMGEPLFALILSSLVAAELWLDGVEEKGIFSRFLKKKTGINIIGKSGREDAPCHMIFSSHLDSARIMKKEGEGRTVYMSLATLALSLVLSLAMTIFELVKGCLFSFNFSIWTTLFLFVPLLVLSVIASKTAFLFSGKVSPGVGDNLTGVGLTLALSRYFASKEDGNVSFEYAFFSSEETGKRGSEAFFSSREKDDAIVINIDAIYSCEDLAVLMSDGNGRVKLDEKLALELQSLSEKMGYRMKTGKLSFLSGSTDAMRASQKGYSATTITSMIPGSKNPGHTELDTIDSVDPSALESVLAVLIRFVEDKDASFSHVEDEKKEESFLSSDKKYTITRW